jgi:nucleotide-binding universal stress UspA family protein
LKTSKWKFPEFVVNPRAKIAKGDEGLMLKKILVATDGSDHAEKAVEYACDMASKYDATIYLIHVVSLPSWIYSEASFEPLKDHVQRAGKEIMQAAEKKVREKGIEKIQTFLAKGDPTHEILQYAEKNDVDMIVLGSRGAGKLGMLMLGSVSHKVCNMAERTCVTVK